FRDLPFHRTLAERDAHLGAGGGQARADALEERAGIVPARERDVTLEARQDGRKKLRNGERAAARRDPQRGGATPDLGREILLELVHVHARPEDEDRWL